MAITLSPDRQTILVASKTVALGDVTTAVAAPAFDVPDGAKLVGGGVVVTTAFDSGTSDVMDVGDGDDPNRYTSSQIDIQAAAYTALTLTGYSYAAADTVDVTITHTGTAATVGELEIQIWYTIAGRGNEIQT